MKKEYDLKKLKAVKKGAVVPKKGTTVAKTVKIDLDIVTWLVAESDQRGLKFESLINSFLRAAMTGGGAVLTEEKVRQIVRDELEKHAS